LYSSNLFCFQAALPSRLFPTAGFQIITDTWSRNDFQFLETRVRLKTASGWPFLRNWQALSK
jgi:hypothetical protein